MSIVYSIFGLLLGFTFVCLTIPPIIRVSIAKHLYDSPNERKVSKKVVPTLGGVAIFIGFILSTIIATDGYNFGELKYLIAAVVAMFFVGLKDDLMDISALKKFSIQLATATVLIVLGNLRFTNLQGVLGINEISYPISFVITIFIMIGLINAINLIDGIDGLASAIGIIATTSFGTWFLLAGHEEYGITSFCLSGSLIAFFFFNVFGKKHKIFMGDTGSLILGVIIAVLVIKFNEFNINQQGPYAIHNAPIVSIAILIIPVIDTLKVFFIRISEKKSPFSPDMNHIHHKFIKLGFSHLKSTLMIAVANIIFIAFTLAVYRDININNLMMFVLASGFIVAYIPSFLLKSTHLAEAKPFSINSEIATKISVKKIKVIGEPFYPVTNIVFDENDDSSENKKKDLIESAV